MHFNLLLIVPLLVALTVWFGFYNQFMGASDFRYKVFIEPYQDKAEAAASGTFKLVEALTPLVAQHCIGVSSSTVGCIKS